MQTDASRPPLPAREEPLVWLPRSRLKRAGLALAAAALAGLVFMAWLRPNMVFDLANLVFCG